MTDAKAAAEALVPKFKLERLLNQGLKEVIKRVYMLLLLMLKIYMEQTKPADVFPSSAP
jgi:hypothetical protein